MSKLTLRIAILIILLMIVIVYGGQLFHSLNYNRKIIETNIYEYIPEDASYIVNFNRNHHFDEYFEIDSTSNLLIGQIKDHITYPLIVVKDKDKGDLLLARATLEQESRIEEILKDTIAPYNSPKKVIEKDAKLSYYPLPKNQFIITMFIDGILAISANYTLINNLLDENKTTTQNIVIRNDDQINHYIKRLYTSSPINIFVESEDTFYALSYSNEHNIILEGAYFGKLQEDSIKLSYNEMNNLLNLNNHYTDSIQWMDDNKLKVWINKDK